MKPLAQHIRESFNPTINEETLVAETAIAETVVDEEAGKSVLDIANIAPKKEVGDDE